MKKLASRIFGGFVACVILVFSMPFSALCADANVYEIDGLKYRVGSGGYVVTDVVDTSVTSVKVPEKIQLHSITLNVKGIDDYAFGYCNNLKMVYVPKNLSMNSMGNVAFLNGKAVVDHINKEVGGNVTSNNVIKYIAKKLYERENYTDAELTEIQKKLESKLAKVDTSSYTTTEDKVMTFIKNIDQMGLSDTTKNKFLLWVSTVPYGNITVRGENGTDIQTYTEARSFLGLKYDVAFAYDLNKDGCQLYYRPVSSKGDGVEDGIAIIGYTGNIQEVVIPDKIRNLPVVEISDGAFADAENLNALRIPKTVETIADESFGFKNGTQIPGFKVYGYSNTSAHRYALKNSMTFIDVTTVPVLSITKLELKPEEMKGIQLNNYSGDIKWVSSDTKIATVVSAATYDNPGLAYVTAVSPGSTVIYAIAGTSVLECQVTVSGKVVTTKVTGGTGLTSYTLETPHTLPTGGTTAVSTTIEPPISTKGTTASSSSISTSVKPPVTTATKLTTSVSTTVKPPVSTTSSVSTSGISTSFTTPPHTTASKSTTPITTSKSTTPITTSSYNISTTISSVSTTFKTTGSTTASNTGTGIKTTTTNLVSTSTGTGTQTGITTSFSSSSSSTTNISGITTTGTGISAGTTSSPVSGSSSVSTSGSTSNSTSVSTTIPATTTTTVVTRYVLLGDANDDGRVTIRDAREIAKMIAKRQVESLPAWSDYNQDNRISIRDAGDIAKCMARIGPKHFIRIIIIVKNK